MQTYTIRIAPYANWTGQAHSQTHAVWLAQKAASQHNLTGAAYLIARAPQDRNVPRALWREAWRLTRIGFAQEAFPARLLDFPAVLISAARQAWVACRIGPRLTLTERFQLFRSITNN